MKSSGKRAKLLKDYLDEGMQKNSNQENYFAVVVQNKNYCH